ncbi:MAG TPA: transglycosylase SLT domain-containing protein [Syntrophorhabdales bacterium]|nr:transglycosylase SLT domain-containing protein [Syntrophorhabdales bacterium]
MARILFLVLLTLALAGCASQEPVFVFKSSYAPAIARPQPAPPAEAQVAAAEPAIASEPMPEEKQESVQGIVDQKPAAPKTRGEEKTEEAQPVPQKDGDEGPQISLLIRRDDSEEDDLSGLLTEDYLGQFDIPVVFNDAVQYFIRYFTTEKRKIFANWLKRSRRYIPMIREILRDQGLPEDLIYLAMIESGFNPRAYSPMKACGPWQFIYETGGRYGLRVNHWVDERRDPEKSTVAAALYLKDLFNQFGNWYLAAAGFNAGEKRIERAVEKHETSDFWELSKYNTLPKETREYIPRLLAAAIIAKEPERFGFVNINYDQPIAFVTERVPAATPLSVLAKAASVDVLAVRALNPELLTGITPPDVDDYIIRLPERIKKDRFHEDLTAALGRGEKVAQVVAYSCKRRDRLSSIMKRYGVTFNDLSLVNSCDQALVARQGAVIYIPRFHRPSEIPESEPIETTHLVVKGRKQKEEPREERVAVARPTGIRLSKAKTTAKPLARAERDYHIVRKGESLAGISEKYGIELATLKQINKLKKGQIYPNMRLELVSSTRKIEKPTHASAAFHAPKKGGAKLAAASYKSERSGKAVKETRRAKKTGKARPGRGPHIRSAKATPSRLG